jgi:hypothetical protein
MKDDVCKHGLYPESACCYCNGKITKTVFSGISDEDCYTDMMNSRKNGSYFEYADRIKKGYIH